MEERRDSNGSHRQCLSVLPEHLCRFRHVSLRHAQKSQLRAVYNNIVKVNKDSPLYKINFTRDTGRFAIDIKEQARSIENFIAALSNNAPDDNAEHAFPGKSRSLLMRTL